LGIGDWGLRIGPNTPIPNTQFPIPNKNFIIIIKKFYLKILNKNKIINKIILFNFNIIIYYKNL